MRFLLILCLVACGGDDATTSNDSGVNMTTDNGDGGSTTTGTSCAPTNGICGAHAHCCNATDTCTTNGYGGNVYYCVAQ